MGRYLCNFLGKLSKWFIYSFLQAFESRISFPLTAIQDLDLEQLHTVKRIYSTSTPNLINSFSLKVVQTMGRPLWRHSEATRVHSFFVWRHYTCPCVYHGARRSGCEFLRSYRPKTKRYIQPNYRGRKHKYAINHIVPLFFIAYCVKSKKTARDN